MKIIIEIDSHDAGDGQPSLKTRGQVIATVEYVAATLADDLWRPMTEEIRPTVRLGSPERAPGRFTLEDC
jgi:hypothetical protein